MLGLLAGRGNIFGNERFARLGGDAGAAVERLRSRQRPRPAARRAGRRPARRWPTTTRPCCWRSRRPRPRSSPIGERQERLVKLTDEVRESARAAAIARVRYREGVADFLIAARRRADRAAGRGQRRPGRSRRVHRGRRPLPRRRRDPAAVITPPRPAHGRAQDRDRPTHVSPTYGRGVGPNGTPTRRRTPTPSRSRARARLA